MPTIYEMAMYLIDHNYFIATLPPDRIFYYYNKLIMAQSNLTNNLN